MQRNRIPNKDNKWKHMDTFFWHRSLSRLLIALIFCGASAMSGAQDRLSLAPVNSYRAEQTLLLDVARSQDRLVVVGDQGTLLLSQDMGHSWQQIALPFSSMLTAVTFTENQTGWLVGHDGLLARSLDAGESWQQVMDGDRINSMRLDAVQRRYSALEQRSAAAPDDEELLDQLDSLSYQLDDAQVAIEEGPTTPMLDVWFLDNRRGFALGGYGILLRTTDGGDSWHYWGDRLPNPDSFHLNSIVSDSHGSLYIAGEAGFLVRSDDAGEHWYALETPYDGSFFAITAYQNRLYLMGLRGHLLVSDNGDDWRSLETGYHATLNGFAQTDEQLLLVGHGGQLLMSQDGERFKAVSSGGRRSFSTGIGTAEGWLLVGEGGLLRVSSEQGDHNG